MRCRASHGHEKGHLKHYLAVSSEGELWACTHIWAHIAAARHGKQPSCPPMGEEDASCGTQAGMRHATCGHVSYMYREMEEADTEDIGPARLSHCPAVTGWLNSSSFLTFCRLDTQHQGSSASGVWRDHLLVPRWPPSSGSSHGGRGRTPSGLPPPKARVPSQGAPLHSLTTSSKPRLPPGGR